MQKKHENYISEDIQNVHKQMRVHFEDIFF